MANQSVTLSIKQLRQMASFVEAVDLYRQKLEELKRSFVLSIPDSLAKRIFPEGSPLWWEREIAIGEKEISEGKYKTFKNVKDAIKYLHK